MTRISGVPAQTGGGEAIEPVIHLVLRYAIFAALLLAVVPFGSVDPMPFALASTVFGLLLAAAVAVFGQPAHTGRLLWLTIAGVTLVAGWALIQTVALPGGLFAHPAWTGLADLGLGAPGPMSVLPADGRIAVLGLLLPATVFCAGLVAFPDDAAALRLLRFVGLSGGAVAIWALVQFLAFPDTILFTAKRFYLDSLTGVFVNRNTAGTYFGLVSLVLLSLTVMAVQEVNWRQAIAWLLSDRRRRPPRLPGQAAFHLALLMASLTALFLTRSRAGIGSTLLAFLLLAPLLATGRYAGAPALAASSFRSAQRSLGGRLLRLGASLAVVGFVGLVFADRAWFRVEVQGSDDARFCVAPAIARAALDNWQHGVGLGTFRYFFPAYRDPLCGVERVWDRAHSVYLEGFLDLGVLFAVVTLAVVAAFVAVYLRGLRSRRSLRPVPATGLAVLILVLAHSAVDFSLQIPGFAVIFALTLAGTATVSLGRIRGAARSQAQIRQKPTI